MHIEIYEKKSINIAQIITSMVPFLTLIIAQMKTSRLQLDRQLDETAEINVFYGFEDY